MNVRFILIFIVISVCISIQGISQTAPERREFFHIDSSAAEWKGDSLTLSVRGDILKRLKSTCSLHIRPLFISGDDTIRFPVISCYSLSGARYRKRRVALSGEKAVKERVVVLGKEGGIIDYRESMNIPSSMQGKIRLQYLLAECCHASCLGSEDVYVGERLKFGDAGCLPPPVVAVSVPLFEANVTLVKPVVEEVKERSASATAYVTYPVNQWKVLPAFGDNAAELEHFNRLFKTLADNPDVYSLQSVFIKGYASIEGAWDYNKDLSHKRAGGMKEYLCSLYGISDEIVVFEGMGEDWSGLRKAVEQSNLADKTAILDIIDHCDIFEGREKRLMPLGQGRAYRYMLRHFFPRLRRMEAVVNYRVRSFNPDEAGQLIHSCPQDLSLQEMYDASRMNNNDYTIRQNRKGYGKEYDIAIWYFPDDAIAHINAASAALVRGEVDKAWLYLNRVKDNPLAANNIGVYCWLCNRLDEAEYYFKKAMVTDAERAKYNLEQLYKWKAEFGQDKEE